MILFLIALSFSVILLFVVSYFITWGGLKILRISGISGPKIIGYVIISVALVFLVEEFFNPLVGLGAELRRFSYFTNNLIYLVTNLILLKYYFHLSGKKLWQFFFYLIITGLILSGIISLVF